MTQFGNALLIDLGNEQGGLSLVGRASRNV